MLSVTTGSSTVKLTQSTIPTGTRFGSLVVVSGPHYQKNKPYYHCACDCGELTNSAGHHLTAGRSLSCGCQHRYKPKHKMTGTKIYRKWTGLKGRCENLNDKRYSSYGGRGIKVCEEWRSSFNIFYAWALANGYVDGMSIDRIDNDGNYEPQNCRWVTLAVQQRNTRQNNNITAFGETKCLSAWAHDIRCMVNYKTLGSRIRDGWEPEFAITTPPKSINLSTGKGNVHERN